MSAAITVALVGVLWLTGCSTHASTAPDVPRSGATGLLTTEHPVTVLDDGDGAQLCGGVLDSLPPQCGGTPLIGWDWAAVEGRYDEASGVRWGDFVLTGTYDTASDSFTVTAVTPGDGHARTEEDRDPYLSPCAEPPGGWKVLDEARTTETTKDAAVSRAAALDDFAAVWVDQSRNPASQPDVLATLTPEEQMHAMNDPLHLILNIAVTEDPAAAEAEIREVWGGMLCVSRAGHTEAELQRVAQQISSGDAGVIANVDTMAGEIIVDVTYDDGSLQRRFDDEYGDGLVHVSSVLRSAG